MPTSPSSSPPALSLDEVRLIARLLHEADLSEIEIETLAASSAPEEHSLPRVRLQMRRGTEPSVVRRALPLAAASSPKAPSPETSSASEAAFASEAGPASFEVLSPTVGVFRALQPPLQVGAQVQAGQKAGAVEALKIPTDIVFAHAGRISAILIEEGSGVEYAQPLFLLELSS